MKKTLLALSCLLPTAAALACSTIVVGRNASATGRVIMGHNEDDGGPLLVRHALVPARDHAAGETLAAEKGCARIPQVARTASFYWGEVKNAKAGGPANADLFYNEHGVLVASDNAAPAPAPEVEAGELVSGGLKYNLRRAIGERATSARAGVELALDLVSKWGYAMPGRLYIIADRDEAWVLQIVKGPRAIARRVPDDAVVTIPNCYVFGRPEPGDLMTPAVAAEAAADPNYDFARKYQGAERWRHPTDTLRWKYMSLAVGLKGELVFAAKPSRKVGVADLKRAFATHYEGTDDEVIPHHNLPREKGHLAVCRDSTIESTICAFAETPAATHLEIATGSPCKTPYVDICPFSGLLPADCVLGGAAVKRLENHVYPEPTALSLAAEPVWIEGAEKAFNTFYGFFATFEAKEGDAPLLTLSAAATARVYVNGKFVAYGPARAAEGFMRLDRWPLASAVRPGLNQIAIEVGNPAVNCFYQPENAGFLLAEIRTADGRLLARTGRDFKAGCLPRVQKTNRLSYQREFGEFYRVSPASYAWRTEGFAGEGLKLVTVPKRAALERGAPYPDFHFDGTFRPTRLTKMRRNAAPLKKTPTLEKAGCSPFKGFRTEELEVNLAELQRFEAVSNVAAEGKALPRTLQSGDGVAFTSAADIAGFPYLEVTCVKPCKVWVLMDEIAGPDGLPNFVRMSSFYNAVGWELKEPGRYVLEAFQPTGAGAAHVIVEDGAATLERFDFRTYVNPLPGRASFRSSDPSFDRIFAAAARSLANNAADLFTDCPGRERGSYFGDTTFTGRGADVLLGDLTIESTLYENYARAKTFRDVPKGMIPMCYPGDTVLAQPHWIAAFGLWSVIQLVEYVDRSGDQATADLYRARAEGILGWFRAARNRDGLLENLPGWVFVEWSKAARFTKGVNYPTNMIYIRFLDAMAKLYGLADCAEEAARLRAAVRRESWNGTWFRDQSVRNANGVLEPQENYSEICQTLAFFAGVATAEGDPDLWQRFVYGLGPMRPAGAHELVWPSNMLFGFSLRFGMLVDAGLYRRAMDETKVCCLPMAEATGTLWEGMPVRGDDETSFSLCHGFPCQSAWVIAQSALGLRKIDRKARTVRVATPSADIPLDWADAEIPLTATESAVFALRRANGACAVDVKLPAGWRLVGGAEALPSGSPESQGVPSAAITNWIGVCERTIDALHGFVILRHGVKIAEGSWAPFDTLRTPHMLYSHSKSFTATAIGFLVDAGKLDLDERIVDIFPDKTPAQPSDNLKALRVRDLLTMNVGSDRTDPEDKEIGGDWEKLFLANDFTVKPGTRFRYDSSATYMLAAIVGRRSGKDLMAFLKEKLFEPIGIASAWSSTCPKGTPCGGWGMYMTTGDLARFGQFLLNEGTWNGKRLLSAEWIRLAAARQTWSGPIGVTGQKGNDWSQGYGFQFWRCRHDAYRADGADGQFTIVLPKAGLVVSLHAGCRTTQAELETVWNCLLPALEDLPLPEDPATLKALRARCANLTVKPLTGGKDGAERFLGATYAFDENKRGFKTVRLERDGTDLVLALEARAGVQRIPVGFGAWRTGTIVIDPEKYEGLGMYVGRHPTAASAAVSADGVLNVRVYVTDTPGRLDFAFGETNGVRTVTGNLRIMRGCPLKGTVRPDGE